MVLCVILFLWAVPGLAVVKPHVIRFGKWTTVKWLAGADQDRRVDLKIRALYVDARLKEYTTRAPHEGTDRLFVVQRVFPPERQLVRRARWNASLAVAAGWMASGRSCYRGPVAIALPEFDPFYSTASWYRDYVAYCGVSDDGKKLYAVVAQVGRRKPVLKKPVGEPAGEDDPDSECPAPTWERSPARVTFQPDDTQKLLFSIRGRVVDIVNEPDEEAVE